MISAEQARRLHESTKVFLDFRRNISERITDIAKLGGGEITVPLPDWYADPIKKELATLGYNTYHNLNYATLNISWEK